MKYRITIAFEIHDDNEFDKEVMRLGLENTAAEFAGCFEEEEDFKNVSSEMIVISESSKG